jgi:hypothetical protein
VGYTRLFGQISQGTDFFPKMQKKEYFWGLLIAKI